MLAPMSIEGISKMNSNFWKSSSLMTLIYEGNYVLHENNVLFKLIIDQLNLQTFNLVLDVALVKHELINESTHHLCM